MADGSGYNREVKIVALFLAVLSAMFSLAACSHANIDNKEAVQKAMVKYLEDRSASTGLDPKLMDITVDAVAFERDVARATVAFTVKGTGTGGMQLNYTLDRKGDEWVVRGKSDSAVAPHGLPAADGGANPATLPMPLPGAQPSQLPAGHPKIDPAAPGSPQ
jgi:hypothetical protein